MIVRFAGIGSTAHRLVWKRRQGHRHRITGLLSPLLDQRLRLVGAVLLHQLMALLVHQQLALDALETLTAQAPDSILAVGTESTLKRGILLGFIWAI